MRYARNFDKVFILCVFVFSVWLMNKSFGYDAGRNNFRIARHQVGDFGLHLGIIRSFSLGDNVPTQSPFFPGVPLPYHYFFDAVVGGLEKIGVPLDIGLNGLSIFGMVCLAYYLIRLSRIIFPGELYVGYIAFILFVLRSGSSVFDYFRAHPLSINTFSALWHLSDYIHMGPFDGSLVSTYFSLNVLLNQRHLIVALAWSVWLLSVLGRHILLDRKLANVTILGIGILLGVSSRVHALLFICNCLLICYYAVVFRKPRLLIILVVASSIVLPLISDIVGVAWKGHAVFSFGFLSPQPASLYGMVLYWFSNLGVSLVLFTVSLFYLEKRRMLFIFGFVLLCILGNSIQWSYRIEHNHSLFNYAILVGNIYVAYILALGWKRSIWIKSLVCICFFCAIASGVLDLFAIKNDFQYTQSDVPSNTLMQWIIAHTSKQSIFLSEAPLLDPVVLAGRYTYIGATYYLEVMGYAYESRLAKAKDFLRADSYETIEKMRAEHISYMLLSKSETNRIATGKQRDLLKNILPVVYEDSTSLVYKL